MTHMSLVFSLLSVLLPHVQLNAKQQQLAAQSQPALLSLLQQLGSATAVAEDALTSVGASWRAGTAVLQVRVLSSSNAHERVQDRLMLCVCVGEGFETVRWVV